MDELRDICTYTTHIIHTLVAEEVKVAETGHYDTDHEDGHKQKVAVLLLSHGFLLFWQSFIDNSGENHGTMEN